MRDASICELLALSYTVRSATSYNDNVSTVNFLLGSEKIYCVMKTEVTRKMESGLNKCSDSSQKIHQPTTRGTMSLELNLRHIMHYVEKLRNSGDVEAN